MRGRQPGSRGGIWLLTNVVNTNGAAAKVMNFDRLGKKVRPGTLGISKKVDGSTQKVPLSKNMTFAVTPLVLTPFVSFRGTRGRQPGSQEASQPVSQSASQPVYQAESRMY